MRVSITTLSKNKFFRLDRWSKVNEVIRYLNCLEVDHKHQVLLKHLDSLGSVKVCMKMYDPEVMVMAFEYAATSRSAYTRNRKVIKLPSLKVLSRLTSKTANIADSKYVGRVITTFLKNKNWSMFCLIKST